MRERLYSDSRIGLSKALRLRSSHGTGPLQPGAEAASVPDLVPLIVLSCPFYGVTPCSTWDCRNAAIDASLEYFAGHGGFCDCEV